MRDLLHRLSAIEERLGRLESGRAPPGDGRSAARRPARPVVRCPGCGLPLRRRAGRCQECGVPLRSVGPGQALRRIR